MGEQIFVASFKAISLHLEHNRKSFNPRGHGIGGRRQKNRRDFY